ncbi:hypothetical protein BH11CYA1_BH11CYA1_02520 [soil metagenome]
MDNQDTIIGIAILFAFPLVAAANWLLSLQFCKEHALDWKADAKKLWSQSKPFLKMQAILIALTIVGKTCGMASVNSKQSAATIHVLDILGQLGQGATYVIELFYVSYLGSTKAIASIATIGIWTITKLLVAEKVLEVLTGLGLILLLAPGVFLAVRTCLFVPIFAAEGHKVVHSIKRSWSLTKGRYWLASRYLSPVAFAIAILYFSEASSLLLDELNWHSFGPVVMAAISVVSALILTCQLLYQGLAFNLYLHILSDENQSTT